MAKHEASPKHNNTNTKSLGSASETSTNLPFSTTFNIYSHPMEERYRELGLISALTSPGEKVSNISDASTSLKTKEQKEVKRLDAFRPTPGAFNRSNFNGVEENQFLTLEQKNVYKKAQISNALENITLEGANIKSETERTKATLDPVLSFVMETNDRISITPVEQFVEAMATFQLNNNYSFEQMDTYYAATSALVSEPDLPLMPELQMKIESAIDIGIKLSKVREILKQNDIHKNAVRIYENITSALQNMSPDDKKFMARSLTAGIVLLNLSGVVIQGDQTIKEICDELIFASVVAEGMYESTVNSHRNSPAIVKAANSFINYIDKDLANPDSHIMFSSNISTPVVLNLNSLPAPGSNYAIGPSLPEPEVENLSNAIKKNKHLEKFEKLLTVKNGKVFVLEPINEVALFQDGNGPSSLPPIPEMRDYRFPQQLMKSRVEIDGTILYDPYDFTQVIHDLLAPIRAYKDIPGEYVPGLQVPIDPFKPQYGFRPATKSDIGTEVLTKVLNEFQNLRELIKAGNITSSEPITIPKKTLLDITQETYYPVKIIITKPTILVNPPNEHSLKGKIGKFLDTQSHRLYREELAKWEEAQEKKDTKYVEDVRQAKLRYAAEKDLYDNAIQDRKENKKDDKADLTKLLYEDGGIYLKNLVSWIYGTDPFVRAETELRGRRFFEYRLPRNLFTRFRSGSWLENKAHRRIQYIKMIKKAEAAKKISKDIAEKSMYTSELTKNLERYNKLFSDAELVNLLFHEATDEGAKDSVRKSIEDKGVNVINAIAATLSGINDSAKSKIDSAVESVYTKEDIIHQAKVVACLVGFDTLYSGNPVVAGTAGLAWLGYRIFSRQQRHLNDAEKFKKTFPNIKRSGTDDTIDDTSFSAAIISGFLENTRYIIPVMKPAAIAERVITGAGLAFLLTRLIFNGYEYDPAQGNIDLAKVGVSSPLDTRIYTDSRVQGIIGINALNTFKGMVIDPFEPGGDILGSHAQTFSIRGFFLDRIWGYQTKATKEQGSNSVKEAVGGLTNGNVLPSQIVGNLAPSLSTPTPAQNNGNSVESNLAGIAQTQSALKAPSVEKDKNSTSFLSNDAIEKITNYLKDSKRSGYDITYYQNNADAIATDKENGIKDNSFILMYDLYTLGKSSIVVDNKQLETALRTYAQATDKNSIDKNQKIMVDQVIQNASKYFEMLNNISQPTPEGLINLNVGLTTATKQAALQNDQSRLNNLNSISAKVSKGQNLTTSDIIDFINAIYKK